jgi:hypothetical protein
LLVAGATPAAARARAGRAAGAAQGTIMLEVRVGSADAAGR